MGVPWMCSVSPGASLKYIRGRDNASALEGLCIARRIARVYGREGRWDGPCISRIARGYGRPMRWECLGGAVYSQEDR
jgi:hypothetical protein